MKLTNPWKILLMILMNDNLGFSNMGLWIIGFNGLIYKNRNLYQYRSSSNRES